MTSRPISHKIDDPLYNSRLLKNYAEYIEKFHPEVDLDSILSYAWITPYELEDQGHWFSQWQVDRFHELLRQKTKDADIARKVGRFAASAKGSGVLKQYALGFITPSAAYWVLEKMAPHLSRASTLKARKLGPSKVKVSAIPNVGVLEKPYQCDNRIGMLEALAKLFTDKFPKVEHPTCIHRGGDLCFYTITWEKTPSLFWKRIRNYLIWLALPMGAALHFSIPSVSLGTLILFFTSLALGISYYSAHLQKGELAKNIESQGDAAKLLLDEINLRYNDALLVKEIGQATSKFLEIEKLLESFMEAMEKRLDFDRGGIWLANSDKTRLIYKTGYGYAPEMEEIFRNSEFSLDNPESKGVAVQAFRQKRPFLVNDVVEIEKELSKRSLEFVKRIGAKSFICVPVVYENEAQGVLFVDNPKSNRPFSQSDISLLMGIAPQIAISLHNAMSYQRLQESEEREKNLRKLFERYVPAPIIKRYVGSAAVDLFQGEEISITALFIDIRGFTSSSETMDAMDVVSFLNDYFEQCSNIITKEKGHINKFTGDGFLALFGAPEPLEHHATLAFNAACNILKLSRRFTLGGKSMEIGIGLHTGSAILGNIGSRNKIEYTAIGDTVNTAARLQELSKLFSDYPIIVSRDAWEELIAHPEHQAIKSLGIHKIRGKKERLEAFGFNPGKDQSSSLALVDKDFMPLQRIKGV
ncbi:MAG: adenylate/guanylate cyclase domain-containing protein [Desulfatiglandales bacterium]